MGVDPTVTLVANSRWTSDGRRLGKLEASCEGVSPFPDSRGEFATSVNSHVTRGHLGYSRGNRAFMSSSKQPYGFTCSQISGVNALRSRVRASASSAVAPVLGRRHRLTRVVRPWCGPGEVTRLATVRVRAGEGITPWGE
jgi:hypothetical protein